MTKFCIITFQFFFRLIKMLDILLFLFKLKQHAINKILKSLLWKTFYIILNNDSFWDDFISSCACLFWYHYRWISKSWLTPEMHTIFVLDNVIIKIAGEFHTVHIIYCCIKKRVIRYDGGSQFQSPGKSYLYLNFI